MKVIRQELGQKVKELEAVQRGKELLLEQFKHSEAKLKKVHEDLQDIKSQLQNAQAEKANLTGKLKEEMEAKHAAESAENNVKTELKKVCEDLEDIKSQLQNALTEKANLTRKLKEEMKAKEAVETARDNIATELKKVHIDLGDIKSKLQAGHELQVCFFFIFKFIIIHAQFITNMITTINILNIINILCISLHHYHPSICCHTLYLHIISI